jgi:ligand-binding sensor domain-containing protein
MWIGTPIGLYHAYAGSLTRRYGLPSENITALAVDGAENLWVGTDAGVGFFDAETYSWTHFSIENSNLVSDDILSLHYDATSGHVYFGSNEGLSRLKTPYSAPESQLQQPHLYPNPFHPEQHGYVHIDRLARNVVVHVFTTTGLIIRQFEQNEVRGRLIRWDGRNDAGKIVAGGIYLVVVTAENGETVVGKVAVIR